MRISKDPADYRDVPPRERQERMLRVGERVTKLAVLVVVVVTVAATWPPSALHLVFAAMLLLAFGEDIPWLRHRVGRTLAGTRVHRALGSLFRSESTSLVVAVALAAVVALGGMGLGLAEDRAAWVFTSVVFVVGRVADLARRGPAVTA